jgi:hypothetical protein
MAKEGMADRFFGLLFGRWWAGLLFGSLLIALGCYFWVRTTPADTIVIPAVVERDKEAAQLLRDLARQRERRQKYGSIAVVALGGIFVLIGIIVLIGSRSGMSDSDKEKSNK